MTKRRLKLRNRPPEQIIANAIADGIPLAEMLARAKASNANRQTIEFIKHVYQQEKSSKLNRLPLREVVRNRELRRLNPTARWLYACLADQHDRTGAELDATRPTLRRQYGWAPSALTIKRALDSLIRAKLIMCAKSQPHSKWARYALVH